MRRDGGARGPSSSSSRSTPSGVGARDLPECLLIQARAEGVATPLLEELVTNRLADLASKAVPVLARQMNVPPEELQQAIDVLRRLDPKPGRRYDSSRTIYVEPDVQVVKVDDDYVVLFNDDGLPRLRVSSFYRRLLASSNGALDGEGRSYLREKMRAAQWLMKSLDQRKRTIVRVAESIVRKQRDFLDWGVAHLRPLILRDVADDIGMHESTVSRVVSNKWMATPRGLLPMKFFFHSAISSSAGRGRLVPRRQGEDQGPGRRRGLGPSPLRRAPLRAPRARGDPHRPAHRGEVPRGASHPVQLDPEGGARAGRTAGVRPEPEAHRGGTMKVEVTARRLTVDAKTKDTIEKRLEKLSKVLPREAEAKVVIRLEKRGVLVEVTITARQRTWTAEAVAADQLTAAQNALDRVAAQAKKTKARVKEEKKHTASGVRAVGRGRPPGRDRPSAPLEKPPRTETYEARRMFDEDALHVFDHGKREVLAVPRPVRRAASASSTAARTARVVILTPV